jgi:UDP-N-acetylmuramoylalanine--D-glutamate ligase
MYTPSWFKGKRITVMGLGLHGGGLGVAQWLVKRGARVTVTDLTDAARLAPSVKALEKVAAGCGARVEYALGRHRLADFTRAKLVVRNPGVPRDNEFLAAARAAGVAVESDISLLFLMCPHPIAAVTGTKGKTTTTMLLHAIMKAHDARAVLGGNMRVSPFGWLDRALKARRAMPITLELSSWQLEDLAPHRLSPHVGVITNILPDHLNRYRDMDDYAAAKELCVAYQRTGDTAILNADDARLRRLGERGSALEGATGGGRLFWFGRERPEGADGCFALRGQVVVFDAGKRHAVMKVSEIPLLGAHNVGNALAAVAAAYVRGVPPAAIRGAVMAFAGVPGRLESVGEAAGVGYMNDTTATTPEAAIAAMNALPKGRTVLIGGGTDKQLEFDGWADVAAQRPRAVVLLPGTATDKMTKALAGRLGKRLHLAASMAEAVATARALAKSGDTVLMSPGAASFGLFKHEFDRGDQFVKAARRFFRCA